MQSIYIFYPVSDTVSQGSPWANRLILQLTIKPSVKFLQIGSPEFHLIPLVYFFCICTRCEVSSSKQAISLHFCLMLVESTVPLETKLWVQTGICCSFAFWDQHPGNKGRWVGYMADSYPIEDKQQEVHISAWRSLEAISLVLSFYIKAHVLNI